MTGPILFLDVDGVLNRIDTPMDGDDVRSCVLRPIGNPLFRVTGVVEKSKVAAVRRVVEACNAKIVVSSSWRNGFTNAAGFAGAIGIAPPLKGSPDLFHRDWRTEQKFSSQRYSEINWWLNDNTPSHYAILDDHAVVPPDWKKMLPHMVQTNAHNGVTNADLGRVCALLGREDLAGKDWFSDV